MKEIQLTQGKVALVDDADFESVSQFVWCAWTNPGQKNWYAIRSDRGGTGKQTVGMHRFIFDPGPGLYVDHVNSDGLDNRRINLRPATVSQNCINRGKNSNNTSGFKGAFFQQDLFVRGKKPWIARIGFGGARKRLGCYRTPEEAARAYDKAALELFGEFAHLNFPQEAS